MAISESSVAEVIPPANVEHLDSLLKTAQSTLDTAMEDAQKYWLTLPDVLQVDGADGMNYLLDPSSRAVQEWGTALASARTALSDAATNTLPALVTRRARLLERIVEVNRQSSDADGAVALADAQYWSAYGSDPESSSTTSARESRTDALHAQGQAREVESQLESDIEAFRRDVEAEEEKLAGALKGISGGDEVLGAWGDEVRVSQTPRRGRQAWQSWGKRCRMSAQTTRIRTIRRSGVRTSRTSSFRMVCSGTQPTRLRVRTGTGARARTRFEMER